MVLMEREMATRSSRYFSLDSQTKNEWPPDLNAMPPLPEVIEDDSEASWALWREATNAKDDWEADTQPMGLSAE